MNSPPVRTRSPIEMMIDRATGSDPSKVKPRQMVTLRCPDCRTEKSVRRDRTDPPGAVIVESPCDKCSNSGDRPETLYFDAAGRQLDYDGNPITPAKHT